MHQSFKTCNLKEHDKAWDKYRTIVIPIFDHRIRTFKQSNLIRKKGNQPVHVYLMPSTI